MTKPLITEPEASRELEDAALRYEKRRSGLGRRFLKAVADAVDRIRLHPTANAPVQHIPPQVPARRASVKGFPYHVVYLEMPAAIHVLAIAHDRRRRGEVSLPG